MKRILAFLSVLLCLTTVSNGQSEPEVKHDTTYYDKLEDKLVTRGYLTHRYTHLKVSDSEDGTSLKYHPDNILSLGIGATYGWLTLNLSYGFGFLNPKKPEGTNYFNLQLHSYSQKNLIDLFGQFYSIEPGFKSQLFGASYQYVLNNKRFSYRAAFLQSERQKKSSGTLLLGAETYFGKVEGDSSIVPVNQEGSAGELNNRSMHFYEFGPNVGYSYTFVIKQNFFVTGSFSVSMDYGKITFENDQGKNSREGFNPNFFSRFSAGYTKHNWGLNAIWLNDYVRLASKNDVRKINIDNGNIQLVYFYRFTTGPKLKKRLRLFD